MSDLLISVAELSAHITDPAWRVFDCRHDLKQVDYGVEAYAKGHLPGAQHLHLDRDLSGKTTGRNGRHPLPDPQTFAAKMGACGVDADTQVVAYDNEGGIFAARLWWLLRWLGHLRVAVLDGGLAAWNSAQLPLEDSVPSIRAKQFVARPGTTGHASVDTDFVRAHLGAKDMAVIDARNAERFRGENETLDPVGGHIPGAINRFYARNLADGGLFKPAGDLRREFDELLAGRDPRSVVQQCGSGVTACHNLLAMEIVGLTGSRLYPGSWSEWCSDPARPVAKGS
ncbi:MAG: sulfurtransferase [Sterolibacterium sp.]